MSYEEKIKALRGGEYAIKIVFKKDEIHHFENYPAKKTRNLLLKAEQKNLAYICLKKCQCRAGGKVVDVWARVITARPAELVEAGLLYSKN